MKRESIKNVLLVTHELSMTGAPVALQYMARQLRDDGVFVAVLSPQNGPLCEEFLRDDLTVIVDSTITGNTEWLKWAGAFDLIVVNTVVVYQVIEQLSERDIPVIWWTHDGEMSFNLGANELLPQLIGENIHVIGGGGYAKRIMDKYRPQYKAGELVYCVPDYATGLSKDYTFMVEMQGREYLFSSIGSIDKRKGQDIFAEAVRMIPSVYRDKCLFLFVGRDNDHEVYKEILALKEDYPQNIAMITEVSREAIRDIYRQSTVVVCTSRDDPMPVFMTESLMLSVPVICSEYTGTCSLLEHKKSGMIYHNNDAAKLAELFMYVIDHPDDIRAMGIAGRKVYEGFFTEEAFKNNFYKVIEEL